MIVARSSFLNMVRKLSQNCPNKKLIELLVVLFALVATILAIPQQANAAESDLLIIAHRGASAERPEHTLSAYERAIDQGADYIEPDLVVTKDLVLIARHENELSDTTDVASREEFEIRRREKIVDGQRIAGWFAEDFTLAEIHTLRAKERLPNIRRSNLRFNGLYQIPTFAEIIKLVRAKEAETGRKIGLYPELKHSNFLLQEAGIDMVDLLVSELRKEGLDGPDAKVIVQSFEVGALQRLDRRVDVKLAQIVKPTGGPVDEPDLRYAEMVSPSGLAEVAKYADILTADIRLILNVDGSQTSLVKQANDAGLVVHAWTLSPENTFLPPTLRSSGGESDYGAVDDLARLLRNAGVEGIFTDSIKLVGSFKP